MASHSSTLAWKMPWTEEPGGLQSMGSLRVGHDWETSLSLFCIGEGNGTPLQCSHITICLSLCWLADIWVVSCLLAIMNTAAMNVNVYFVCVLYCASNLWQFKGHAKVAEMNAVVSTFGILWDQKVETRGGSVAMIDFCGFWLACTSLWGHPCKSFYFRLISVRWTFHQGFILLWIMESIKD